MIGSRKGRRRPSSQERILGRDGTTTGPEAAVVAELRYLVGRVERRHGSLPNVVGVLSALVGEGVTFTTHALAAVLSTDFERSVCVVSLDWGRAGQGSINELLAPWSEAARSLRTDDEDLDPAATDEDGLGDVSVDPLLDAGVETYRTPGTEASVATSGGPADVDVLDDLEEPWADDDLASATKAAAARAGTDAEEDEVWTASAVADDADTVDESEDAETEAEEQRRARASAARSAARSSADRAAAPTDLVVDEEGPSETLPVLSERKEVDLTWGVADVVRGSTTIDDVLVDTGRPRLWAVPSGVVLVDERPRMANHVGLREVVKDLGARFDHVLLDLPPVLDASESLPLAGLADACVLVVAQGATPVRDVQDAQAELTGVRLLGAVLNRARTKTPTAIARHFVGRE